MKRSQAALFDGIMFLLFASVSVAMVFVFLNEYGKAQDATLRSGYVLAYVQQVGKGLFFLHAKTLRYVGDAQNVPAMRAEVCWYDPESGVPPGQCNGASQGYPYSDLMVKGRGCDVLGDFELSTISDLLKKDLGDGEDESKSCLDDKFGSVAGQYPGACRQKTNPRWNSVAPIPGKTALRCALKELLKPLQTAGFKYFVDVQREKKDVSTGLFVIPQQSFQVVSGTDPRGFRISNHWLATQDNWDSCEDVVSKGRVDNLLTVSIPFRVNRETTLENMMNLVLRVCIWPSKAGR